ncbi:helix-turn-helix domain-containing protein [Actinoallomurus sp. NBC_01490]|uniref:helix-turn-helix domain-containing protein n=1 Tax=Actinoallomurus sp. NBC_01490 TaxID=2903557 RepID=UPI002E350A8F|nr:helix-turn-helix transcriptional regulator [Actinoallomurus sp. NBC_01490]
MSGAPVSVEHREPNINARRLGLYLRTIREFLELSYDEAAVQIGCRSDWLVRVETGFEWPSPVEVERMMDRYQVRGSMVADVVIDLASRPNGPEWLSAHAERLKPSTRDVLLMESEASVIRTYGVLTVPYLARAEAYVRHIAPRIDPDCDVDAEWDLLDSRQRHRPGGRRRDLDVIVDEGALTLQLTEPEVMVDQLRHLLDLSLRPDTTVRVIPRAAPFYEARANPFDLLEFPEVSDRLALVHSALGTHFTTVDLTDTWNRIEEGDAVSPEESRALIRRLIDELPQG